MPKYYICNRDYSLKKYPVKVILPITSIYPLFTAILLILTGQEALTIQILLGTIVIISGVYMVTRGDNKNDIKIEALIYGLLPAIAWGSSVLLTRYTLYNHPGAESISLTGFRVFFIGLVALIIFLLSEKNMKCRKR